MTKKKVADKIQHSQIDWTDRKIAEIFKATSDELRMWAGFKEVIERKTGTKVRGGLKVFLEVKREFIEEKCLRVAKKLLLSDDFHTFMRALLESYPIKPVSGQIVPWFCANIFMARISNACGENSLKV